MSVMGNWQRLRRIGDPFERHQTSRSRLRPGTSGQQIGESMRRRVLELQSAVLRHLAVAGLALLIGTGAVVAQSGDAHPQEQPGKAAANGAQSAEAAQVINGPAGNPECVWLGRRVVRLMWLDDLDTAFRHLDLYDRFGCPAGHIQAAFRCLTRFGGQIDSKVADSLNSRVHGCWINPAAQPQAAAAATPAPPTTAGSAGPATTPAPAAAPSPAAPAPAPNK